MVFCVCNNRLKLNVVYFTLNVLFYFSLFWRHRPSCFFLLYTRQLLCSGKKKYYITTKLLLIYLNVSKQMEKIVYIKATIMLGQHRSIDQSVALCITWFTLEFTFKYEIKLICRVLFYVNDGWMLFNSWIIFFNQSFHWSVHFILFFKALDH